MHIKQPFLNILVNLIFKSYFNDSLCIIHYHDNSTDLINVQNFPIVSHRISDDDDIFFEEAPKPECRHFLLQFLEARWAFDTIEEEILRKKVNWYSSRKYLIIIADEDDFFNSTRLKFVRDVLIVYAPNENLKNYTQPEYNLYTHKYVGSDGCNDVVHLDTWYTGNLTFGLGNSLYPDKVTDQQGRELRAWCTESIPFASCGSEPPIGNEYNIIVKYAEQYNMTLNINSDNSIDYSSYRHIYTKEVVSDEMLKVICLVLNDENNCDILFGGYPSLDTFDLVKSSRYSYVVSVPIPKIKQELFMFLEVFDLYVWLPIVLLYILARGVLQLSTKQADLSSLTLYGLLINQPANVSSATYKSTFSKYILMLMLVASVILVTAYNSRLASIMVSPMFVKKIYENDINTLDELAESNLRLIFFDKYYYYFETDERVSYRKLYEKVTDIWNVSDPNLSEAMLSSREYAVARYRRNNGDYFELDLHLKQMRGKFKPITPELYTEYNNFLLRKSSVHTPQLQRLVRTAEEAGLMAFWEDSASRVEDGTVYQREMQESARVDKNVTLNLGHLKGIFVCLAFGSTIAFVAFTIEVFIGTAISAHNLIIIVY